MKKQIITILAAITIILGLPQLTTDAAEGKQDKTVVTVPNSIHTENPFGVITAPDGTIFFSSQYSHKIYAIDRGVGNVYAGFNIANDDGEPMAGLNDGDKETALFNSPAGITMDEAGNIYVADAGNHAIRVIGTDGKVTTLAGDGLQGNDDGNGDEARFFQPLDVAVADDGTVYVADTLNHVIRKVSTDGTVSTLTKNPDRIVKLSDGQVVFGGDYSDGKIAGAMFNEPSGLAIDEKGNLFVADTGNHLIRYIDFDKDTVSTVAGEADRGDYDIQTLYLKGGYADGDLDEAAFKTPLGITITNSGNVLVADTGNSQIRYINIADKTVSTLTENGDVSYPAGIDITNSGDVIVSETREQHLKKLVLWKHPADFGSYDSVMERYDDEELIADYAFDSVYQVQRMDIMVGSVGKKYLFSPKKLLTRAQFSKMMVNALELATVVDKDVFPDVIGDEWYADFVHTAAARGIVNGYENGKFGPNDPITRQQIAVMVGRAMNWSTDADVEKIYKDQHLISEEALPFVVSLYEKGVMRGNEIGNFSPSDNVPREMGAVILARLLLN